MITHHFVENIGRRLMAVHAEEKNVAEEMQRMEQTARARLQALRDEAANIDALLDSLDRFDQSSIESFLAGGAAPAPIAAPVIEDEAPAEVEVPAEPVAAAPAIVEPAAAEPIPASPVAEPSQPEARGLKQSDADILIVMRGNRQADGICRLSMTQIAKLAGVPQKTAAEQCVKRLRTAGIIMPTKDDPTIFHVADKGQRVPLVVRTKQKDEPAIAARPAPATQPTSADAILDDKVLDLVKRASEIGGGQALFAAETLATRANVSLFRLNISIGRLSAAGKIKVLPSLPGHVTIELVRRKVAA